MQDGVYRSVRPLDCPDACGLMVRVEELTGVPVETIGQLASDYGRALTEAMEPPVQSFYVYHSNLTMGQKRRHACLGSPQDRVGATLEKEGQRFLSGRPLGTRFESVSFPLKSA